MHPSDHLHGAHQDLRDTHHRRLDGEDFASVGQHYSRWSKTDAEVSTRPAMRSVR